MSVFSQVPLIDVCDYETKFNLRENDCVYLAGDGK